jgi:hypothetical protein
MGDQAADRTARTVALEEVPAFVAALFSAERPRPVVAVTTRHNAPLLDPGRLAERLAERAEVVLIETGEATAALGVELGNERLGVFGGAGRIWWPGLRPDSDPYKHPLIWVHPGEPLKAEARILELLGCASKAPAALAEGSDVDALVVSVGDWGAILDVGGVPASCHVSRIAREGSTTRARWSALASVCAAASGRWAGTGWCGWISPRSRATPGSSSPSRSARATCCGAGSSTARQGGRWSS